ncbi:hypothetical protein L207DRAFT_247390 [Hyaloscypha variabilis F]|uniref:Uncharacterized protein n=1 Tax=Hyaloscypha variabilis (strain UAMH 11265 / GT02V1 / F) TaxID=1149755 RepID=A0A2J6S2W1_HYAVF|nr:hypothetical protein L207DRAFT_247390 [Hyaloscypha variabilis F]
MGCSWGRSRTRNPRDGRVCLFVWLWICVCAGGAAIIALQTCSCKEKPIEGESSRVVDVRSLDAIDDGEEGAKQPVLRLAGRAPQYPGSRGDGPH